MRPPGSKQAVDPGGTIVWKNQSVPKKLITYKKFIFNKKVTDLTTFIFLASVCISQSTS